MRNSRSAQNFSKAQIQNFYVKLSHLMLCTECDTDFKDMSSLNDFKPIFTYLNSTGRDVSKLMKELTSPCSVILKRCTWKSEEVKCYKLFKWIKTTNGYCCSFNYYGTKTVQNMSLEEDDVRYFPLSAGVYFGLEVETVFDETYFTANIKSNDGFEVTND